MKITKSLLIAAFAMSPLLALAQQSVSFTSTADGSQVLQQQNGTTKAKAGTGNIITIKGDEGYQTVDGFGYALTYSSCFNLLKMSKADRTRLLERIYSPTKGYGVSYARISIGCNDFSSTEYTLCDEKGPEGNLLEHFALASDEVNYVIPILKEVLAINPQLKIMAAPWTCPRWMKVGDLLTMRAKNSWTDGHLNPNYRDTYASYFVKFIETMKQQGISIYAVTPQNEPLNKGNCASLYLPWKEEAPLVKSMAKAFHDAGLKTRIYVFDHNFNYDDKAGQDDYPIHVYDELGTGYEGEDLVVGAAYHDYGGDPSEMTDIHNQKPGKEIIFTEESIGTWNNGRDLKSTLVSKMKRSGIQNLQNWSRSVIVWNLMLDDKMGPNLDGGCQTCYGAIDINSANYTSLSYNSHYFVVNHLSSVIKPGARRVATGGWWAADMDYVAFKNTDGSYAMIFASSNAADQHFSITDGKGEFMDVTVPANSIVSVRFGNFKSPQIQNADYVGIWIIGATGSVDKTQYGTGTDWLTEKAIPLQMTDSHTYSIDLTVGKQLNKDFVNFKFFGQPGWGREFTANGTYKITTQSTIFGIGTGSDGHDNGNIYLRDGKTLTDGDVYRFSVDIGNPFNVVLTITKLKPTGIITVTPSSAGVSASTKQYNIIGQQVGSSYHGIVISKGKKYAN